MKKKEPQNQDKIDLKMLSQKIKTLRKETGLSAEVWSYEHKFNRTQYAKYERGFDIRFTTLMRLLREMDIKPSEFFKDFD